jgi:hypothetical protein
MSTLDNVVNGISAIGALGTASFGLVDFTKFFGGGISNAGFGHVRSAVTPYITVTGGAGEVLFGAPQVLDTLKANWMNGMAKADQKAVAKSMIRLMLKPGTAPQMARLAGVNAEHLTEAAQHIENNADSDMGEPAMKALGAFDVAVSATLDLGYERGDQYYRNASKFLAAVISVALAMVGGAIVFGSKPSSLILSAMVGLIATPLAPVAKDVSTAIQTAVKAVSVFR